MLDFHDEFIKFDDNIKITEARKTTILSSRDAVRDKIRKYFHNELELNQPTFRVQGSFAINTALNPLDDNEVDSDDGVYLNHVDSEDERKWPLPTEAHGLIMKALENHTQDGCESKTSCVRVFYRNIYHLDLPIYIIKDKKAFLAQTKNNEWIDSDSKAFKDWFFANRNNSQTTRIVRYLKAWRDYLKLEISSIELTILAVNCHVAIAERDDLSFSETVRTIKDRVIQDTAVNKPVSPFENLWGDLSENQKSKRIDDYSDLFTDVNSALSNKSYSRASSILIELFGSRFPEKKDTEKKEYIQTSSGSKPWGK